jgi:hypothetical protein
MALKVRITNDGKISWKATQNDYVDGQGNRLGALGTLLLFDFNTVMYGWTKFEKGVQGVEKFLTIPDDVDDAWFAMIEASKPKTVSANAQITDAYRISVRNATLGPRLLTISSKSAIKALNSLNIDYDSADESKEGRMPIVRLKSTKMMSGAEPFLTEKGEEMWTPVYAIEKWGNALVAPSQAVAGGLSKPISVAQLVATPTEQEDHNEPNNLVDEQDLLAARIERMKSKRSI